MDRCNSELRDKYVYGEKRGDNMMTAVAISVLTIIIAIELVDLNDSLSKIARELERIRKEVTT